MPQIDKSSGLGSNAIRCVLLDNDKRVWAGTDNGLTIVSANTTAQKKIIEKMGIASIWGLNFLNNLVFIGSRFDGLYIFDETTGKLLHHYPSTEINLIRKIKLINNEIYILSNNGVYKWVEGKLIKLLFTPLVNGDFATDLYFKDNNVYAIANPTNKILLLKYNSFDQDHTSNVFQVGAEAMICAKAKDNILVIGGDGFYMIKYDSSEAQVFQLPKGFQQQYVVWDIVVTHNRIMLALGDNYSSEKGLLYIHGDKLNTNEQANGFLTSMTWDAAQDLLYYGDLNRGLYLQRSISGVIADTLLKYAGNDDAQLYFPKYADKKKSENLIILTKIFQDTTIVVDETNIRLYNNGNSTFLKNIPVQKGFVSGLVDIQLLQNKLYLFYNYLNGIHEVDLTDNTIKLITDVVSFLPVAKLETNKIIYLNKEKGFNVIIPDKSYPLTGKNKSIPFAEDFVLIKDHLYVLVKDWIGCFRIDYVTAELIPVDGFKSSIIEGFAAKWLFTHNGLLYVANDKGIVRTNAVNGMPENYFYFGNYNHVKKPLLINNTLVISTLTNKVEFPMSAINASTPVNTDHLKMIVPKAAYENLGFLIHVSYPNELIEKHSLKSIQIHEGNRLVFRKYFIGNQINLIDGLKYANYNVSLDTGNAVKDARLAVSLPLNRNPYFFAAIGFFLLLSTFLLVKNRLDKKEHNKKIMQNRLQILKQNLNPHFVFNSMNLISSLILEKKYQKAIEVVTDFSNLQRNYLETNNKHSITVTEELNFLNSYLKLQQTRFYQDNEFQVHVKIDEAVDTDNIFVPPLILQPLAENSIRYGVIASIAPEKIITVDVRGRNPVIIGLEDNGKLSQYQKGLGLGHTLVLERIQLYNQEHKSNIQMFTGLNTIHHENGYRIEIHIV